MSSDIVTSAAGQMIGDLVGLRATSATSARLASALRERQAATGLAADEYLRRLRSDPAERQQLLERLTVQETSFFREAAQLDSFVTDVLPSLPARPLVIWSAGCATGQEPYSLAMILTEAGVSDFTIVASDISHTALARTQRGLYRDHELRGLSTARRDRFFGRAEGGWQVSPALRARLRLVHHNLAIDPPPLRSGECSAIFCRNVFIYLRRERITACVEGFHDRLLRGGVVFLGVSESLWPPDSRLVLSRVREGVFCYRRSVDVPAEPPTVKMERLLPPVLPRPPVPRRVLPAAAAVPPMVAPRFVDLTDDVAGLRRRGEAAMSESRPDAAVLAFRKVVYLQPDDPVAHLQLGLAFEASGDADAGHRAFLASRRALERAPAGTVEARMEGWSPAALAAVLDAKLGDASCP